MDEPWDTSLGWMDAAMDLPNLDSDELDRVVVTAMLELFDQGLARYFWFESFGESYARTPADDEFLEREELIGVLASGSDQDSGRISAPLLGIRATADGREWVFRRWPEDRKRWEDHEEFKAKKAPGSGSPDG